MLGMPGNPGSSGLQLSSAPNQRRLIPGTVRPSGTPRRMRTRQCAAQRFAKETDPLRVNPLFASASPRPLTHPETRHCPRWAAIHKVRFPDVAQIDQQDAEPIAPQHPGRHQHVNGVLAAIQAVDEDHGGCAWLAFDPPARDVDAGLPAGKTNGLIIRHGVAGQVDRGPIVVEDDPVRPVGAVWITGTLHVGQP